LFAVEALIAEAAVEGLHEAVLPRTGWLKHGLRIQTFYGTSDNAVRLQLWASICVYLALATTRKQLGIATNLTTFVQVLSLHALSKVPIPELFADIDTSEPTLHSDNQLTFKDLR